MAGAACTGATRRCVACHVCAVVTPRPSRVSGRPGSAPCRARARYRSLMPPMMPWRRKQTSSTNTRPSTSFQAAPSPRVACRKSCRNSQTAGADQRAEQRAAAADGGLHDELAGGVEHEGVRRHEALQHAEQSAGEARVGGGDHEGGELVALDVVADGGGAQRVLADRAEDGARPASARCAARSRCRRSSRTRGTDRATSREVKFSVVKPRSRLGVGTPGNPFSPPVQSDSGLNSTK